MKTRDIIPGRLYLHHAIENGSITFVVVWKKDGKLKYRAILRFKEEPLMSGGFNNIGRIENYDHGIEQRLLDFYPANIYEYHFLIKYIFGENPKFKRRKQ
jgi:hypothetical protein